MAALLYLDDVRAIPKGFEGVRSFEAFTYFILTNGLPKFISFGHDLGESKSGYDCAKWLIEYCINKGKKLPDFAVHSQNPVGKENIVSLLQNYRRLQKRL